MDKIVLDAMLEKYKAQPVGHGYIDIIVSRNNYNEFVAEIIDNGFTIIGISWWEWCPGNKENEYGLGGPESIFYPGWFSELAGNVDDLKFSDGDQNNAKKLNLTLNLIKTKTVSFANEKVTFENSNWLTPALWLDVPKEWRNKYND